MRIDKPWDYDEEQDITINGKKYNVHACIELARNLTVKLIRIDEMYMSYGNPSGTTFRTFLEHMKSVNEADLKYPILLNADGAILDGKHRFAKAILNNNEFISTKRFIKDPEAGFTWV